MEPTAVIILVGNEILNAQVEDMNAKFLLPQLRELGVAVKRIVVIPDEVDEISHEVRESATRFSYVFTSGGVGPTHDDLTIAGVARAFDRRVIQDEELLGLVATFFGEPLTPEQRRFTEVPEGAQLIYSDQSPWPVVQVENVYVFPGVPGMLRRKFTAIRDRFRAAPFELKSIFLSQEEVDVAPILNRLTTEFPTVVIGSYPTFLMTEYRVKVTLESKDGETLHRAFATLIDRIDPASIVRTE